MVGGPRRHLSTSCTCPHLGGHVDSLLRGVWRPCRKMELHRRWAFFFLFPHRCIHRPCSVPEQEQQQQCSTRKVNEAIPRSPILCLSCHRRARSALSTSGAPAARVSSTVNDSVIGSFDTRRSVSAVRLPALRLEQAELRWLSMCILAKLPCI